MKLLFIAIALLLTSCGQRVYHTNGCSYVKRGLNRIPTDTIITKP